VRTTPEERVRELARKSAIGGEDAARLLAAMRGSPTPARYNPFARWSGEVTATAGVLVAVLTGALSLLSIRTDGALDMHRASGPVSVLTAAVDQLLAYPVTGLVFWAVALGFARRTRLVDVLGVAGVARVPSVLFGLPIVLLFPDKLAGASMLIGALLGLTGVGLHVFLIVLGFHAVTGLRGGRLALASIVAIVGAEVTTKLLLLAL